MILPMASLNMTSFRMFEGFFAISTATWVTLMLASVVLYLTPGIDMLFKFVSGAAGRRKVSIAAGMGVALGNLFYTFIAILGVAALIQSREFAFDVLRYAGAVYMVYLTISTWRTPTKTAKQPRNSRCILAGCAGQYAEPQSVDICAGVSSTICRSDNWTHLDAGGHFWCCFFIGQRSISNRVWYVFRENLTWRAGD